MHLEALKRACVDLGSRISDPQRCEANEALRNPLAVLQGRIESLRADASEEAVDELAAELDNLVQQVK